jgi:hypothetical protein
MDSSYPEEVLMFKCGNISLELYQSEFAGTNKTTVLNWDVGDNVKQEVESLKQNGVTFEHYNFPDLKMDGDVHLMGDMKVVWFKGCTRKAFSTVLYNLKFYISFLS